jgi:ssDNA-binding Zn-finger/Zn-ribbon topoisomerase 1
MGELFDQCDELRTCPNCGHTLKSYDTYAGRRVLACLSCPWAITNDPLPSVDVLLDLAADKEEHARLELAFETRNRR